MRLQCASNFKTVHYSAIHECFVDGRGHLYHYQYGINTSNLRPPVSFIPTIVINKVIIPFCIICIRFKTSLMLLLSNFSLKKAKPKFSETFEVSCVDYLKND